MVRKPSRSIATALSSVCAALVSGGAGIRVRGRKLATTSQKGYSFVDTRPALRRHFNTVKPLLTTALLTSLLAVSTSAQNPANPLRQVLVQPIILQGNDGQNPARARLPESQIDAIFKAANLDIHFAQPIAYNNSLIRDGSTSLKDLVAAAERDGMMRSPAQVINLFFVGKLENRPGPIGVGQTPGWVSVVALGDNTSDSIDATVISRALAENMGLPTAQNDPQIVDRSKNLMSKDTAGTELAPHQIAKIQTSPLAHDHVECLPQEAAARLILDDSYAPYFANMMPFEMATLTGKPIAGASLDQLRAQTRERFAASVLPFTTREAEAINWFVTELESLLKSDYPLFAKEPWRFIKFDDSLCGGFSHTRGSCILFSANTVARILAARNLPTTKEALKSMGHLFLHEQIHVFQRLYPSRFTSLYQQQWGFVRANVVDHPWLKDRQIQNPDAPNLQWIVSNESPQGKQWYWPRTVLRTSNPVPRMGADFLARAVNLKRDAAGSFRVATDEANVPKSEPLESLTEYARRFPMKSGLDHPNEVAAYMFSFILMHDYVLNPTELPADNATRIEPAVQPFRVWCRTNLR